MKKKKNSGPPSQESPKPLVAPVAVASPSVWSGLASRPVAFYGQLALVAVVLIAYGNTWGHYYVFDDFPTIAQNKFVQQGLGGLPEIFTTRLWDGYDPAENIQSYRPVTLASFALEYQLFGLAPSVSHLVSVLIYLASVLLIYRIFRLLIPQATSLVPWLVAFFFALHPIHTEPVNNLKSRDELLALAFGLAAVLYYLRYCLDGRLAAAAWAGTFYLLALLSKETPITFLAVAPAFGLFFKLGPWPTLLRRAWPLAVAAGVFLLLRHLVISAYSAAPQAFSHFDQPLLLATSWSLSLGTKLWLFGKNLSLLVLPYPLTSSYFYNDIPILPAHHFLALLSLVAILGLLWLAYRGWRRGQLYGLGLVFFFLTFSLFSHFLISMGNAMGERLLLTPSLGACIVLADLVGRLLPALPTYSDLDAYAKRHEASLIVLLSVAMLCIFGIVERNKVWQNNFTLATNDVVVSPNSYLLTRQAALEYDKASQQPMGALARKQMLDLSHWYFQKALEIDSTNIELHKRHVNFLFQNGRLDEALQACKKASQAKGANQGEIALTTAKILMKKGDLEHARQTILGIKPQGLDKLLQIDVFVQAGMLSNLAKNYTEAIENFKGAYALAEKPEQQSMVLNQVGNTYMQAGQLAEAQKYYQQAITLSPNFAEPFLNLGGIAYQQGQLDQAIHLFGQAVKINPKYALAHKNLALAYQAKGDQALYQQHLKLFNQLNQ
jgi:protein O-mannosyl-transferase